MGPFGSSIKVQTFVPEGVPIISGQHLHGSRLDDSPGYNFITEAHAKRLANAKVSPGDVVFTHRGNIGQVAYIPNRSQFKQYVVSQSQFYMRCDPSKVVPEFVVAYFGSPEGKHKLLANASQVGVPAIAQPVSYLRTIDIPLPGIAEQRAIAHVLGTLDDKIELNRRMNETLEAMARALFKSWFVDFEPVRANMAGREVGLPPSIGALFPSEMAQAETREAPIGWHFYRLTELADHHTATTSPGAMLDVEFAHYSVPAYDRGQNPILELGANIRSNKTLVPHGAVLLSKLNPEIPRVWLPSQSLDVPQICSTEFLAFTPMPPASRGLLFSLFCDYGFRTTLRSLVTGTSKSHQRVPPKALKSMFVVAGTPAVLQAFGKLVTPWLDQTNAHRAEAQMLAKLRDSLLPRLVSGELRVLDAERIVAALI